jgi:glycosyltransferase involved in cell wall biosynthesis
MVRNLNRRRYRPVVLTMFDEHGKGPEFPADVEIINVRRYLFDAADEAGSLNSTGGVEKISTIRMLARKGRTFYHRLLSAKLRKRIGVGRRIVQLRAWVTSIRRGQNYAPSIESNDISTKGSAPGMDFINAMRHHNPVANGLSKALRRFGTDAVLIAVMEEATIAAWLAQASIRHPFISSLHTVEGKFLPRLYPENGRYLAEKWFLSEACGSSEVVVFPSQGCAQDLHDVFRISSEKTRVVWNPVDCMSVRRKSWQHVDAVSAWKRSAKSFRMVHVGRLDVEKNHELLLQVCSLLKQRGRDFSLAIIGKGHDRARIEQQIQERGLHSMVFLAGEQQNPFPWMAAADALLLTSHFEAFALVLVEAMVCGTAVISVDCPTGPGEVLAGGEYGLLAPNGDCDGLAAAVERVMGDGALKESLVKRGFLRAEDFDVKKIVPQWEAMIDAMHHRKQ